MITYAQLVDQLAARETFLTATTIDAALLAFGKTWADVRRDIKARQRDALFANFGIHTIQRKESP